jgi:hypothetical protein
MKYLAVVFFKRESGEWLQPGVIVDLGPEEAALLRSRGVVKAYQTQMVTPPETRVVEMPKGRRRRNA